VDTAPPRFGIGRLPVPDLRTNLHGMARGRWPISPQRLMVRPRAPASSRVLHPTCRGKPALCTNLMQCDETASRRSAVPKRFLCDPADQKIGVGTQSACGTTRPQNVSNYINSLIKLGA